MSGYPQKAAETCDFNIYYHEETRKVYLRLVRVLAILTFLFIPLFIYTDMTYIKLPLFAVPWRAFPIFVFLVILLLFRTSLRKSYFAVTVLVNTGIISLLVMMYSMCIIVEIYNPVYLPAFISGTILLIAVAFTSVRGGYRVLLPILLLTFIPFLVVFLYYWDDGGLFRGFMKFVNTMAAIAGFSVLSEWIERMRIKELRAQSILLFKNKIIEEKALKFEKELELARIIQTDMMPPCVPDCPGVRFSACYRPMQALAGDFFDFVRFKENNLIGIFISDVSGHGIPASLITSMIKALINSLDDKKLSPSQCLRFMNSKITGHISDYFVTVIYAIYDYSEKTLLYARGGHPYPLLVRDGSVVELKSDGKLLGAFQDWKTEEKKIQLQPGDRVFFFTDGLLEARNAENLEFRNRLYNETLIRITESPDVNPAETLFEEMMKFTGGLPLKDDVCIICLEVLE